MLDSQDRLCVAEIVFYAPVTPVAFFLLYRHGFGWFTSKWLYYLIILATIRIARCSIELQNAGSIPSVTSSILSGLGLSPMLLSSLSLVDKA
jgi:hypothetical protein